MNKRPAAEFSSPSVYEEVSSECCSHCSHCSHGSKRRSSGAEEVHEEVHVDSDEVYIPSDTDGENVPIKKRPFFPKPKGTEPSPFDRNKVNKKTLRKKLRHVKKSRSVIMTDGSNIKHSEGICKACKCQTTGCKYMDFYTIKRLRQEVFPENTTKLSIRQWRFTEVQNCFERTKINDAKYGVKNKAQHVNYFIPGRFRHDGKDLDVCRSCWQEVTGCSDDALGHILKRLKEGTKADTTSVGGQRMKIETNERLFIHAWIECYIQCLVCYSPEERKHELPGGLNLSTMYAGFKKDWKEGVMNGCYSRTNYGRLAPEKRSDLQEPSYSLFCKVWKKEYGDDYKIPKSSNRFPQCNWCARCRDNIERAPTHEIRMYWKGELFAHFLWVTENRKVYYKHREKARKNPSK